MLTNLIPNTDQKNPKFFIFKKQLFTLTTENSNFSTVRIYVRIQAIRERRPTGKNITN